MPLAGAPDRARATASGHHHADPKETPPEQSAEPKGRENPLGSIFQIRRLEDREADHAHGEGQGRGPRVLAFAAQERLPERPDKTEARALEHHTKTNAEEQENRLGRVAEPAVQIGSANQPEEEDQPRQGLKPKSK